MAGANGEEWLVQRPSGGGGYAGKKFNGKAALGAETAGVYGEEDVEHEETDDPGDESLDGEWWRQSERPTPCTTRPNNAWLR